MYYTKRVIKTSLERELYQKLLLKSDLTYELCDYQFGIFDGNDLIGAVSLDNNCIKQICIESDYHGEGIASTLVSEVISYASSKGIVDLFVYTKPQYEDVFNSIGFYTLAKTDLVVFLENNKHGINKYLESLATKKVSGNVIGSLVMNLNPITNGHLYLIKTACEASDHVHLFLVKEDKSSFPFEVRLRLLKEAVKDFDNLTIHSGSDYIISSVTFPTYFIKSSDDVDKNYPEIDASIFAKYIARALNINTRFLGSEPYSKTTNIYNEVIKDILPKNNIKVYEIERVSIDNEIVSASKVRAMIKDDNIDGIKPFVPQCTYEFLKSADAKDIIEKIRSSQNRH